jgi:hypothetical protein
MATRSRALLWLSTALLLGSLMLGGAASLGPWLGDPGPPVIADGALLVVDREALARVDLQLIHEELIPDWVVSSGGMKRLHFERILREADQDPNLGAVLARMRVLFEADPVLHATELLSLVRVWNAYLAKAGEPWRLAGEVRVGEQGGVLYLKSYRVILSDGRVSVGEHAFQTEIRRRVDSTTLVDGWLGSMHDHKDGVVVLLDSVTQFALDQVWVLLDPHLEPELDAVARNFAPAVREQVRQSLGEELFVALEQTAEDRHWMNKAAKLIHARHACGSAFVVARVPWNGMSARDLGTLQQAAAGTGQSPCPDVTEPEALLFAVRSSHVRRQPRIRAALERLIGFVASAVVVHEARHAADALELAGQPVSCVGCPEGTSHVSALEGSAYAASFAHPETGALALYQACALDEAVVPDRVAMVRFLAERITAGGCYGEPSEPGPAAKSAAHRAIETPRTLDLRQRVASEGGEHEPPLDLAERATQLEREVFGRSEPIEVLDFPASLPVGEAP